MFTHPDPGRSRTRRRLLAAVGIVAVLAAGIGIGVLVAGGSSASPYPPATLPTISPAQLRGLRWSVQDGLKMPVSPVAGPHFAGKGLAWGFAHTPLGALLAAIHIPERADSRVGPPIYNPTISGQIVGDATALRQLSDTEYAQGRALIGDTLPAGASLGPSKAVLRGFRWESYTPAAAIVHLLDSAPDETGAIQMVDERVEVRWSGGDWKAVAPTQGNWAADDTEITDLKGYTMYSGHS